MFIRRNLFRNIVLVAALCLLFLPLPANSLWWREVFNSGHTVLFALLSFIIYQQIKAAAYPLNTLARYFLALFAGISLAVLTELLQGFVQRDASLADLYSDVFGLLAGLCLIAAYELKKKQSRKKILVLLAAGVGFLLTGVLPLLQLSWSYVERQQAFPVIADFGADWTSRFVRLDDAVFLKQTRQSREKAVYPVQFNHGEYPGISLIETEPDWSGYRFLRFNIFSENEKNIMLTLRIHDVKHDLQFSDRFNMRLIVRPGLNKINVPLRLVARAPRERDLDLVNVAGVILFVSEPHEPVQLEVSNIYLE